MFDAFTLSAAGQAAPAPQRRIQPRLALALGAAPAAALVLVLSAVWGGTSSGWSFWLSLWGLGCLALILGQVLASTLVARLMVLLNQGARGLARRRAERRMWALARKDPRLHRRLTQAHPDATAPAAPMPVRRPVRLPLPYL